MDVGQVTDETRREAERQLQDALSVRDQQLKAALARVQELEAEREDILQKDRIKTHEINLLVPENKQLAARVTELEAEQKTFEDTAEYNEELERELALLKSDVTRATTRAEQAEARVKELEADKAKALANSRERGWKLRDANAIIGKLSRFKEQAETRVAEREREVARLTGHPHPDETLSMHLSRELSAECGCGVCDVLREYLTETLT